MNSAVSCAIPLLFRNNSFLAFFGVPGAVKSRPWLYFDRGKAMSNYHILTQDKYDRLIEVVFHFPVAGTGTNKAGVQWRIALLESLGGAANIVSQVAVTYQTVGEEALMKTGAVLEHKENVRFTKIGLSEQDKKAEISAKYNVLKNASIVNGGLISKLQADLEYFGLAGTAS